MQRALAFLIWFLTLITVALFLSGRWWWPRLISAHGVALDRQFAISFATIGIAFIAVQLVLGFILWRGHNGNISAGNPRWEILWTAATATIFIALALTGQRVWSAYRLSPVPANAFRVEVWGQQYQWNFHYGGPDQKLGRIIPQLISDSGGNPLGLDRAQDPHAQDDIVAPTLILPLNRPTELILRSRDVNHSLWLPNLRFKQDAVPGMQVRAYLTATVPGLFDIACAELCGPQHYKMNAKLLVLPETEFDKLMQLPPESWVDARNALLEKYRN